MNDMERVQLERERLQVQREKLAYRRERREQRQTRRGERHSDARAAWDRFKVALPLRLALLGVAAVWLLGCLWSLREQNAFAAASGFLTPWVLGLVLDGLAVSCAGVAYAASLDGRPAVMARLILAVGVAASATSNAVWAAERSGGQVATIALAAGVPVAANVAFEVLLGERRRVVKRRRGLAAPTPVEPPRLVRLLLSPIAEPRAWRARVLAATAPMPLEGQLAELERLLLVRATRRQERTERKATRHQHEERTRQPKNPRTAAAAEDASATRTSVDESEPLRLSRNTRSPRGEKTMRLLQLLSTEVSADDPRSDSELARVYAPRVDMHGSSARKVIRAFRAEHHDITSDNGERRVLRLAGGGQ